MTPYDLSNLRRGDSIIGLVEDDEVAVVDVLRKRGHTTAWVHVRSAVLPYDIRPGGPEIRCAFHVEHKEAA